MRVYDSADAPAVLKDGRWQLQGRVQVWVRQDGPHPMCGTDSGYYRHLRQEREKACGECLTAHRLAERDRQLRRRERVS